LSETPKSKPGGKTGKSTPPKSGAPKGPKSGATKSSPPSEAPPPSSQLPGRTSNAPYIIGAALLLGLGAVLVYMRGCEETKPQQPTTNAPPVASTSEVPALPDFSPPPPEEPDAGSDAGPEDAGTKVASGGGKGTGSGGVCGSCGQGVPTGELKSAVSSTAGMARGCYNRALQRGGAEGKMVVSVSVGSDGSVCGAAISSDTVGDPSISQCVISKFKSRSYPRPQQGCVVVNVPINFQIKK
jgi:hypothetical protein